MRTILALLTVLALAAPARAQVQTPEQFFGFKPGADGELARYPKILEYFQLLAKSTDRVKYEELGKTTMGNVYALVRISSPQNLARFDRLVEINRRLAEPRGLADAEAQKLAAEGKPFYLIYATIHSTEVSNGQAITHILHRLATDNSAATREILDNSVVLMVPSQNPDGQHLVIDHWYKTKGTNNVRTYPDLYHRYVGHDDNRDWFMFTQKETRMNIELIQNKFKPIITHDMHQQGATGSRIFVPPFTDPHDVNFHPVLAAGQAAVGSAMATALLAEGKEGVAWLQGYDMWAPARQYMIYHGQPRILTEIASSGALADPYVNPRKGQPIGPQEPRWNFPVPYSKDTWTLQQQVDYGVTAALAGMSHVAKYGREWLYNFYKVHRDWANYDKGPYAFVVPAAQRDPYATYEMLDILDVRRRRDSQGHVAVHRERQAVRRGFVGDQDRAAVRRLRQDDARKTELSGPAVVPGRTAGAALRRDRPHAVDADGRHRRCDREAVRRAARAREDRRAGGDGGAGTAQGRVSDRPRLVRHLQDGDRAAEGQRADVPRGQGV